MGQRVISTSVLTPAVRSTPRRPHDAKRTPCLISRFAVSESVRDHSFALPGLRSMNRIDANNRNARAFLLRYSQSWARRRHRLSQAKVRSTTQRLGRRTNPFAESDRLTISTSTFERMVFTDCLKTGP